MDERREEQAELDAMLRDEEDAAREAQAEREYWSGLSETESLIEANWRAGTWR